MNWNLEEAIEYYKKQGAPGDQGAVISLLREAQEAHGGSIPRHVLGSIAAGLGTKESFLLALIRRIPSLRLADIHCLEVCAGPNCGKNAALAAFADGIRSDKLTVRFVPCMRMCGKGPNIRWDGTVYHQADTALVRRLMEEDTGRPVKE